MRRIWPVAAVLVVSTGCHGLLKERAGYDPCPPAYQHQHPAPCPPTRAEDDGGCEKETVVHTPRQKVVVETPGPTTACAPGGAAPGCQPHAGAPFMGGAGMMVPQMAGGAGMVGGTVRDRTGLGFALDTIRIPIPFIRPIAVQRPAEVTFQMPVAQGGFVAQSGFVAPAGMAVPMQMPMGGGGFVGAPGGMVMVPQQTVGYGQVTVQGQMTAQQAAFLQQQQAGMGQLTPQQLAQIQAILAGQQPPPGGSGGFTGGQAQDRLKLAEQQLKELEQLCEKLKEMKAQQGTNK